MRDASIGIWRYFSDLDLSEAKKSQFKSMHDCFIRELKDGARPVDPDPKILTSPCDAIVGASGRIAGTDLFQIKGMPYRLEDLLPDPALVDAHRDGRYVTLRLTSSMYHRFHAPHDCRVDQVTYIAGDTWNVNPIALKRIEKLFCKNERAVLRTDSRHRSVRHAWCRWRPCWWRVSGCTFSIRCCTTATAARTVLPCDAAFRKGQEMGWFQHGSTIVMFAPGEFRQCDHVREGTTIRMGQPLLRLP